MGPKKKKKKKKKIYQQQYVNKAQTKERQKKTLKKKINALNGQFDCANAKDLPTQIDGESIS